MKNGVISLGEALIDFIPADSENINFQKSPGGAPANVAVGIARLGGKSSFIGKVGDDVLGKFLKTVLADYGVGVKGLKLSDEVRTGLVFVTLGEKGERSFDFYIDPSADRFLEENDLEEELFTHHKILHFGSISLISEPARSATLKAVRMAKENGMIISYDPNLRLNLWDSSEQARNMITTMLSEADVLKISEEELEFLTGEKTISAGIEQLKVYGNSFVLVTQGEKGSIAVINGESIEVPAMTVDAVDTTGAGDAYVSGILYSLNKMKKELSDLSLAEAKEIARFASVSGGLAASSKGAMTALPTLEQVDRILGNS